MEKPLFIVLGRKVSFVPDPGEPDKYYSIRRLSLEEGRCFGDMLSDMFVTAHITGETMLENFLKGAKDQPFGQALMSLLVSFPTQVKKIYAFLAPLIKDEKDVQIVVQDFSDPDKFPLPAMWSMAEALSNHPDITDFFSGGQKFNKNLLARHPQVAAFVKKISSPSDGNPENSPETNGGKEPSTSSGLATD